MPKTEEQRLKACQVTKEWRLKNPDKVKAQKERHRLRNPEKRKVYGKLWRLKNKDKIKAQEILYRKAHPNRSSKYQILEKQEILTHYGNGHCSCAKCGFSDIRALTIDHINNNGAEHRKELRSQGIWSIYRWLKKNQCPSGYQTLCMNCQWIKQNEFKTKNKR